MKKYLLFIVLIMVGVIIGGIGASTFWSKTVSYNTQTSALINISELENLVSKIYATGDFNSSVIALNYLSDKLEFYKEASVPKSPNYDTFITDLGLTCARLFLVYESRGKQDLAEQEYQKVIALIGDKFKISSQKELREIIEKIDKSARNRR